MTFNTEQNKALAGPLNKDAVKERRQGGSKVSYIEGWHAIAEANRIFGFDGWTRETDEIKCVAEKPREIGQDKKPGWGVTYIARVRIRAGGVVREGCGSGHGIGVDLGEAHESAIKEAETDAMKRALMTFGNPFGLALYDKTQSNVVAFPERLPPADQAMLDAIDAAPTVKALNEWLRANQSAALASPNADRITAAFNTTMAGLRAVATHAAG